MAQPRKFYIDSDRKVIDESLITTQAITWAKSFIEPRQPKDRFMRNPKLTSSQLRRFHIEAKAFEEKVKGFIDKPDERFKQLRPTIKMMKSKVAYACPDNGRDRKVPEEFRRYIEDMIDSIDDIKDFKAFCLCFEAVVGFYYGLGGR